MKKLNIQRNERLKLFFISIHNPDSKNIGVKTAYSKSRYAYRMQVTGFAHRGAKAFDSGFYCALMNTNINDWSDEIIDVNDDEAIAFRLTLKEQIQSDGWTYVGDIKYVPKVNHGRTGNCGWGSSLGMNLTQEKFYQKLDRVTAGLVVTNQLRHESYLEYIRSRINTKGELLQYVRGRMGIL